jgi:hypothetical protein
VVADAHRHVRQVLGPAVGDSGATRIPDGQTEYALPHILPLRVEETALTAQWHAEEMSQDRPVSMSSKAPVVTSPGVRSAGLTDDVVEVEPARPSGSNS